MTALSRRPSLRCAGLDGCPCGFLRLPFASSATSAAVRESYFLLRSRRVRRTVFLSRFLRLLVSLWR